jgi:hypothetical protein
MVGAMGSDFEVWYMREHPRLVAALLLVTGDVDLAREAVDEACSRALARWERVAEIYFPGQLLIDGPVRLVRYDRASPTVVVSTYQFCPGGSGTRVYVKVFVDTGHGPVRQIANLPADSMIVDAVSF